VWCVEERGSLLEVFRVDRLSTQSRTEDYCTAYRRQQVYVMESVTLLWICGWQIVCILLAAYCKWKNIWLWCWGCYEQPVWFDVRGSVHHSIIHIKNPTRCSSVSKFYFIFVWSSTCFGQHTAHHQEPKTALAASGFAYVEGCWLCSCCQRPATTRPTTLSSIMQNQRLLAQF